MAQLTGQDQSKEQALNNTEAQGPQWNTLFLAKFSVTNMKRVPDGLPEHTRDQPKVDKKREAEGGERGEQREHVFDTGVKSIDNRKNTCFSEAWVELMQRGWRIAKTSHWFKQARQGHNEGRPKITVVIGITNDPEWAATYSNTEGEQTSYNGDGTINILSLELFGHIQNLFQTSFKYLHGWNNARIENHGTLNFTNVAAELTAEQTDFLTAEEVLEAMGITENDTD